VKVASRNVFQTGVPRPMLQICTACADLRQQKTMTADAAHGIVRPYFVR
jgi:hypothetical protein